MAKSEPYTEDMVKALTEAVEAAGGSLNYALAHEIAALPIFVAANKSARSLMAKARSLEIPYIKEVAPSAPAAVAKEALIGRLENATGLSDMGSLKNVKIDVLERLVDFVD